MSARLADLDARFWANGDGRRGMGITFIAPGTSERVGVAFANPIDGGPPMPQGDDPAKNKRWHREGTTLEDLTLSPSVDAYEAECDADGKIIGRKRTIWHGHVVRGSAQ